LINLISDECSRTTQVTFRGRFIDRKEYCYSKHESTGFDRAVKDDNGLKEIEIHIVFYNGPDKRIYVGLVFLLT